MVAAGNRESDKGVTYRMPTPLANRFIHQEMKVDFTSWQEWAVNHNIHKDVVGYLSFAKKTCTSLMLNQPAVPLLHHAHGHL
jgi:hypothetical protein